MPDIESKQVSLESLASGDAAELFQLELEKVLDNISDPNTPWKTRREVSLTVSIEPNEERDYATVSVDCHSKLAKGKARITHFYMGMEGGRVVAYEQKVKQAELQLDNVRQIDEGRKK